jgi:flagellar basal-body rod protein FlgB
LLCELNEGKIMGIGSASALTVESIRLALDATGLRQRVIADNIANVNSPDHVRMKVVFEEHLAQALAAMQPGSGNEVIPGGMLNLRAELEPDHSTRKVELDDEMAAMSANSLRYHALTKGLSRYLSIASIVVSPSRG